jgi:hypothetical protein
LAARVPRATAAVGGRSPRGATLGAWAAGGASGCRGRDEDSCGSPDPAAGRYFFAGAHILEPEIFGSIPAGRSEINSDIYPRLITAGKIQLGSGWWFLDQKEGMEWQLKALSNTGLLSRFVGMVTDSRSFMSFPRHEYFRRVLCNLLGSEIENGELPNDEALVGGMVRKICFENARQFLGLELPSAA